MKKLTTISAILISLVTMAGCSTSNSAAPASSNASAAQSTQQASNDAGKQGNQQSSSDNQNGNRRGPGQGGQMNNQELLSLLKIDSDTLQSEFKAGKSLADIASEKGVQEQQVIDLLVKQSDQRTAEAVKSGKLTQDKADQMKSNEQDRIKQQVEHKGGFGGGRNPNRQGNNQGKTQSNASTN